MMVVDSLGVGVLREIFSASIYYAWRVMFNGKIQMTAKKQLAAGHF